MFRQGGYLPSVEHHIPPNVSLGSFGYYLQRTREWYEAA